MTEQTMTKETASNSRAMTIFGEIVKWTILALLLFTCIMAVYRKFGG